MTKLSHSITTTHDAPGEKPRLELPPKAWENLTDPRVIIVGIIALCILGLGLVASGVHVTIFR